MRVRPRLLVVAVSLLLGACTDELVPDPTQPTGTPVRTVAAEPTTSPAPTDPPATAYPTVPPVTEAPPKWAPATWQTPDVRLFAQLVSEELDELGANAQVVMESGYALLDNGTKILLIALAQRLSTLPQETWRDEISTFLVTALRPAEPDDYSTFTSAQPLLRVIVGKLDALHAPTERIAKELAPGLFEIVVIDAPEHRLFVSPAQADLWGKAADDLLFIAVSQTLNRAAIPEQDGVYTSLTGDPFASSRLIDPRTLVADLGPEGMVVVISNTDSFVGVTVDADLTDTTILGLAEQAKVDFANGPSPASDDLYWWHDGVTETITLDGGQLLLPAGLADLITKD